MGYGDEIMVTAQVKAMQAHDARPVLVMDARGRPRWSPIWENNPRIVRSLQPPCQMLTNGPNARPYVRAKYSTHWMWQRYRCLPGEIYLTDAERAFAQPYAGNVLVEPNLKFKPEAVNKAWIWERWEQLARMGFPLIQVGPPGTPRLEGVPLIETPTFRLACAVLSVSRAYVGVEGGLHHAAAALNVPAVVLFGGFISPDVTGYAAHRNLYRGGRTLGCGLRRPCNHCRAAMESISVEEVAENLRALL